MQLSHEPAGNAGPPHNISSWFQCKGQGKTRDDTADHIPHDFYVIGTQEDPLGEREWADTVKGVLRNITNISFKQVSEHDREPIECRRRAVMHNTHFPTTRWQFTLCGTFGLWSWPSLSTKTGSPMFSLTV